ARINPLIDEREQPLAARLNAECDLSQPIRSQCVQHVAAVAVEHVAPASGVPHDPLSDTCGCERPCIEGTDRFAHGARPTRPGLCKDAGTARYRGNRCTATAPFPEEGGRS